MILTKEGKALLKKVNKVLAECPSDRMRFLTIGDPDIFIANNEMVAEYILNTFSWMCGACGFREATLCNIEEAK